MDKHGMPYGVNIDEDDILLDDYSKNLIEWVEAGGTAIKVRNNINCSGKTWKGDTIYNQDSLNFSSS